MAVDAGGGQAGRHRDRAGGRAGRRARVPLLLVRASTASRAEVDDVGRCRQAAEVVDPGSVGERRRVEAGGRSRRRRLRRQRRARRAAGHELDRVRARCHAAHGVGAVGGGHLVVERDVLALGQIEVGVHARSRHGPAGDVGDEAGDRRARRQKSVHRRRGPARRHDDRSGAVVAEGVAVPLDGEVAAAAPREELHGVSAGRDRQRVDAVRPGGHRLRGLAAAVGRDADASERRARPVRDVPGDRSGRRHGRAPAPVPSPGGGGPR